MQTRSEDYGIFGIACMACILFARGPKTQFFDETVLQVSLLQMLTRQQVFSSY